MLVRTSEVFVSVTKELRVGSQLAVTVWQKEKKRDIGASIDLSTIDLF